MEKIKDFVEHETYQTMKQAQELWHSYGGFDCQAVGASCWLCMVRASFCLIQSFLQNVQTCVVNIVNAEYRSAFSIMYNMEDFEDGWWKLV